MKWDAIYAISLRENETQRREMDENLNQVGLKVNHFIADRHPKGSKYGCFHSHRQIMRDALDAGHHHILVLEDDATPNTSRWTAEVLDEIERAKAFDCLYLGAIPIPFARYQPIDSFQYLFKSEFLFNWGSHAYIVPRHTMQKIASSPFTGEHYDAFLARLSPRTVVVYPTLMFQSNRDGSGASNTEVLSKSMGMEETQETGTWFSRYWILTYLLTIILFVVVVCAVIYAVTSRSTP